MAGDDHRMPCLVDMARTFFNDIMPGFLFYLLVNSKERLLFFALSFTFCIHPHDFFSVGDALVAVIDWSTDVHGQ